MRYVILTIFMFLFCAGSLYAQNEQQSNSLDNDTIAKVLAIQKQLIKIKQDSIRLNALKDVGYGYQKSSNITGAVTSVNTTPLQKDAYTNIYQLLMGRVAGMIVTPDPSSPSGYSIRIRGVHSIVGTPEPLIVLNGFPLAGSPDLRFIDPEDVKSIDVLKDASASIYGTRSSNGVILIQTN